MAIINPSQGQALGYALGVSERPSDGGERASDANRSEGLGTDRGRGRGANGDGRANPASIPMW